MWSYRCLESGTVIHLSSCQHSDVAQKAIFLLFIVLALSSRTDEGLWSCGHELPRLVSVSFKCFGSPDSSGPLERWQRLRRARQGSILSGCVVRIVPAMAFPFRGRWICQKVTSSLTWGYKKKFWGVLQKWYHLFSLIFMILSFFFHLLEVF